MLQAKGATGETAPGVNNHLIRELAADVAALAVRGASLVSSFETRSGHEQDAVFRKLWRQQAVALKAIDRRFLTLAEDMKQLVEEEDDMLVLDEHRRMSTAADAYCATGGQQRGKQLLTAAAAGSRSTYDP